MDIHDETKSIFGYHTVCNQLKPSQVWIEIASTNDFQMLNLLSTGSTALESFSKPTQSVHLFSFTSISWQMPHVCDMENMLKNYFCSQAPSFTACHEGLRIKLVPTYERVKLHILDAHNLLKFGGCAGPVQLAPGQDQIRAWRGSGRSYSSNPLFS